MNSIVSGLTHLSGWVAYTVIGALVFGETAVFLGFVLPGETAAVLGGVLASRGHLSLPLLIVIVVVAAIVGPIVGYEIGRRTGERLFASRQLRPVHSDVVGHGGSIANRLCRHVSPQIICSLTVLHHAGRRLTR